jgi:hypothetical protein
MNERLWVGTLDDGSQILVRTTTHDDGTDKTTIAQRAESWHSWGPPIVCEDRTP